MPAWIIEPTLARYRLVIHTFEGRRYPCIAAERRQAGLLRLRHAKAPLTGLHLRLRLGELCLCLEVACAGHVDVLLRDEARLALEHTSEEVGRRRDWAISSDALARAAPRRRRPRGALWAASASRLDLGELVLQLGDLEGGEDIADVHVIADVDAERAKT